MEARVDGSYRLGRLELLDEDRLRVEITGPSGVIEETWVRRGSDAEKIGETEKNLLPGVRERALDAASAPLVERSIRSLLAMAADSIASQSWGTIELGGESFRFLVLGCHIGSGARDSVFVSGAGEAPDGRTLEVELELERSLQGDSVRERVSILLGDRSAGELWMATGGRGTAVGPPAGEAARESAAQARFILDGDRLRMEGQFRSRGAGVRDGAVEVTCPE